MYPRGLFQHLLNCILNPNLLAQERFADLLVEQGFHLFEIHIVLVADFFQLVGLLLLVVGPLPGVLDLERRGAAPVTRFY